MWGESEHYDTYDIFASVMGPFLAIITFELITFTQSKISF